MRSLARALRRGTCCAADANVPGDGRLQAPRTGDGETGDARSDLCALGCLLYECVTGRPPFRGDGVVAVISQHLNMTPINPSWHRIDCPQDLEALILALFEKDPAKGPGSAEEVAAALGPIDARTSLETPVHINPLERLAHGVFVGRDAELERLRDAFDATRSWRRAATTAGDRRRLDDRGLRLDTLTARPQLHPVWSGSYLRCGARVLVRSVENPACPEPVRYSRSQR